MKHVIKQFFEKENEKYELISKSDLNGIRLVESLTKEISELKKQIYSNKEPEVIFNRLVSTFDSLEKRIMKASFNVNSSRKEVLARVLAIKECYQLLEKEEEAEKSRKQKMENIEKEIKSGKDYEKDRRDIGTRPEKIRDVRTAKTKIEESKNIT